MFAVIRTGGKQYKVAENDVISVEKLDAAPGDVVELREVLMLGGGRAEIGTPTVAGAAVAAEVIEQGRAAKILVFKKKRRKNYRRRIGHRQHQTVLRITEILTGGKKASKPKPAAKKTEAKKPAAKKAETKKPAAKKATAKPAAGKPAARAKKPTAKK